MPPRDLSETLAETLETALSEQPAQPAKSPARTIYAADLFCGGGGFTTALLQAVEELGADLKMVAVNHWNIAVAVRKAKALCLSALAH
jgi:tRNA/tmRNA/rRNA uracil-C5-methylase (TrmA/RlmC/RlmD family)